MKITKNETQPNEFKIEMTLTLGKLLALQSALGGSDTTLSRELFNNLTVEMKNKQILSESGMLK